MTNFIDEELSLIPYHEAVYDIFLFLYLYRIPLLRMKSFLLIINAIYHAAFENRNLIYFFNPFLLHFL